MSQQASSSKLDEMAALKEATKNNDYSILVTGATGFIGKKLTKRLSNTGYKVIAMSRTKHPDTESIKFVAADALELDTLTDAFKGIETAFYLLHSMEGSKKEWEQFADREKTQAQNFLKAAENAGVKRIIYLGGLVNESLEL